MLALPAASSGVLSPSAASISAGARPIHLAGHRGSLSVPSPSDARRFSRSSPTVDKTTTPPKMHQSDVRIEMPQQHSTSRPYDPAAPQRLPPRGSFIAVASPAPMLERGSLHHTAAGAAMSSAARASIIGSPAVNARSSTARASIIGSTASNQATPASPEMGPLRSRRGTAMGTAHFGVPMSQPGTARGSGLLTSRGPSGREELVKDSTLMGQHRQTCAS